MFEVLSSIIRLCNGEDAGQNDAESAPSHHWDPSGQNLRHVVYSRTSTVVRHRFQMATTVLAIAIAVSAFGGTLLGNAPEPHQVARMTQPVSKPGRSVSLPATTVANEASQH